MGGIHLSQLSRVRRELGLPRFHAQHEPPEAHTTMPSQGCGSQVVTTQRLRPRPGTDGLLKRQQGKQSGTASPSQGVWGPAEAQLTQGRWSPLRTQAAAYEAGWKLQQEHAVCS